MKFFDFIFCSLVTLCMYGNNVVYIHKLSYNKVIANKIIIKLKNDTGEDVTVYNAGSGIKYKLLSNTITIIKMEIDEKLFYYEGKKKGRLLLTASKDIDGKVQLYSKL